MNDSKHALIRPETSMQTSFEVLFLLSMFVPVGGVVVGALALIGSTLMNRQGHAGDAEASHHRGLPLEHPVAH
jgi:hypothetical protein